MIKGSDSSQTRKQPHPPPPRRCLLGTRAVSALYCLEHEPEVLGSIVTTELESHLPLLVTWVVLGLMLTGGSGSG